MAKPGLGTKRLCPHCGAKFYDLDKDPIVCPKCGTDVTANESWQRFRVCPSCNHHERISAFERIGLLLERDGAVWRSSLCSQVDPAALLELTDVEDNALPPVNAGGIVVGVLILGAGAFFLLRRIRRHRALR